jgi:hypothetical protein
VLRQSRRDGRPELRLRTPPSTICSAHYVTQLFAKPTKLSQTPTLESKGGNPYHSSKLAKLPLLKDSSAMLEVRRLFLIVIMIAGGAIGVSEFPPNPAAAFPLGGMILVFIATALAAGVFARLLLGLLGFLLWAIFN